MRTSQCSSIALLGLLLAAGLLRASSSRMMAVEHFDEGVYASNLFSDHIDFHYPDLQFYAPPLLPAIFEWVLIFSGANPHAVMWVNVILGTALVAAVFWTTRELLSALDSLGKGRLVEEKCPASNLASSAGLASAAMIAFSDIFIEYSRAALTDIPVCLWMTLAVGAGTKSFRTGRWMWGISAGVLTALAWWTKYNGWLPLAILGAGLAGGLLLTRAGRASWFVADEEHRSSRRRSLRKQNGQKTTPHLHSGLKLMMQWSLIAGIATLLWTPYLAELQPRGGYAAVAANHKGYVVGFAGWGNSVLRHLEVDRYYSGWSSSLGVLIGGLLAGMAIRSSSNSTSRHTNDSFNPSHSDQMETRKKGKEDRGKPQQQSAPSSQSFGSVTSIGGNLPDSEVLPVLKWGGLIGLGLLPVLVGVAGLIIPLCMMALLGVVLLKRRGWRQRLENAVSDQEVPFGLWILLAWIAGLTLVTPMYRPYPRLILPWMIGMSSAAAMGVVLVFRELGLGSAPAIASGQRKRLRATSKISPVKESSFPRTSSLQVLSGVLKVEVGLAFTLPLVAAILCVSVAPLRFQEDRRGLERAAIQIIPALSADLETHSRSQVDALDCVVYVLAEPGLYYHLAAREDVDLQFITQPASDLGMLTSGKIDARVPAYLVTGPHARKAEAELQSRHQSVREVGKFDYVPSSLVVLDGGSPAELDAHQLEHLKLWAIQSSP